MVHSKSPISVSKSLTQQEGLMCPGERSAVSPSRPPPQGEAPNPEDVAQNRHQDPQSILKHWGIILNHVLY